MPTKIGWTDETWNPVTGCTPVSAGCARCYARRLAEGRLQHTSPAWKGRRFADVRTHPERLDIPLHWRKPRMVFVPSMGDLFHPDVPVEFARRVFDVMRVCPWHTFQVLTKRPERIKAVLYGDVREYFPAGGYIVPNIWLGASVEDQQAANTRIRSLLAAPAGIRFLSVEPLLGPIDFGDTLAGIDWVITGGESGPGARPCEPEWIDSVVRQARQAGCAVYVKQAGSVLARKWGLKGAGTDFQTERTWPQEWPGGNDE